MAKINTQQQIPQSSPVSSGGNISGIAAQLAHEGLIDRCQVPNNRRTFIVTLTQKGRDEFETIAKAHERWVIEMLGQLAQDDVSQLINLLLKVKNTVLTDPIF
mgnify:CR=1 FL=1